MNFGSFKYFARKQANFTFNKSSFKMMSSSTNNSYRFAALFSNKAHIASLIRPLNNITKRGICGKIANGNGINILNDPEITGAEINALAASSESIVGLGMSLPSNLSGMIFLNDYLLIADGKVPLLLIEQLCILGNQLNIMSLVAKV